MRRRNDISFPRVNGKTVVFTGGVNEGITNLELKPGDLFRCLNYEEIDGAYHGYSSVEGFERHDGQPSPSDVYVEFLEDFGNDDSTKLLLESEDAEDILDKSGSGYTIDSSSASFDYSRLKWGEGSYLLYGGLDSKIVIDQTTPLDFDATEWTIDGYFQSTNVITTDILAEKTGVWELSVVAGKVTFKFSTDGGSSYNRSLVDTSVITIDRWQEISVVHVGDEVLLGVNGSLVDSIDITGETIHGSTADILVGNGLSSVSDVYVDSFRVSTVARWASTGTYSYSDAYAFSEEPYYVFNADDRDREAARALIQPVPGEGDVRDVHIFKGDSYAVRDAVGGATGALYKESPTGWSEVVPANVEMDFTTSAVPDATVTPVTGEAWTSSGGASGVVYSYTLEGGNPSAGTGYGHTVLIEVLGTLADTDIVTITSTGDSFTIDGTPVVNPLLGPGENVDFKTGRFAYFPQSAPNSLAMYFVANTAGYFAYDGTTLIHLPGVNDVTDAPTRIMIFADRLWLAYENGRLFYSVVGDPTNFSAELGAGEIFLGDTITNLVIAPGGHMAVIMRNSTKFIKRNPPSDVTAGYPFIVSDFTDTSGGYTKTATSMLGDIFFCDDRGPTTLQAVDAAGDFEMGDMKKKTHITYQDNKSNIVGAFVQREKSQYRIMFDDPENESTRCIFITFSDKSVKGSTLVEYPVRMTCFAEGEDSSGDIKILAGSKDGYVYLIDKGVSFDGDSIVTSMTSAFYHYSTPRLWKRFHRILFEISAPNRSQFYVQPDFNYSSSKMLRSRIEYLRTIGQGGVWGQSKWGSFIWGGSVVSNPMMYMPGYGYNMSVKLRTDNKHAEPHVVHNMIVDYSNGSRVM